MKRKDSVNRGKKEGEKEGEGDKERMFGVVFILD